MFYDYFYSVGGRTRHTYFQKFNNAKDALQTDVANLTTHSNWRVIKKIDRMNVNKGFYEFEYVLRTDKNEIAKLCIIDSFFQD